MKPNPNPNPNPNPRLRYPKRWLLRTIDADVDVTLAMPG